MSTGVLSRNKKHQGGANEMVLDLASILVALLNR